MDPNATPSSDPAATPNPMGGGDAPMGGAPADGTMPAGGEEKPAGM